MNAAGADTADASFPRRDTLRRLSKYTRCQGWPPRQWKQRFDTTLEFPFIDRLLVEAHAKTNTDQNSSFENIMIVRSLIFNGLILSYLRRAGRSERGASASSGHSCQWIQLASTAISRRAELGCELFCSDSERQDVYE